MSKIYLHLLAVLLLLSVRVNAAVEIYALLHPSEIHLFGCKTYSVAGDYDDTLKAADGITDSIVTLHLKEPTSITDSIYENETYLFGCRMLKTVGLYSDTLIGVGWDSIVNLNLIKASPKYVTSAYTDSIYTGETYLFGCEQLKTTGTYKDTVTSASGKDSIITLTLIWAEPKYVTSAYTDSIYTGETYLFGCEQLKTTGTYKDTVTSASGKDSIITLTLIWAEPKYVTSAYTDSIYTGETYLFGCEQLKATGTYKDTVTSASGKDSIITLTLIWAAEKDTLRDTVYATICFGDSYPFGSKSLNTQGFYRDTLKTTAGKDSISNLDLTVLKALADTVVTDTFIFADDTYTWREKSYNTSGRYEDKDTFKVYGCDSVYYRLQLDVRSIIRVEEPAVNKVVCINETIISRLQSIVVNKDTSWTDSLRVTSADKQKRYDSIYTYNITVYKSDLPATLTAGIAPVCGMSVDVTTQNTAIQTYITAAGYSPNATFSWEKKQADGTWAALTTAALGSAEDEVTLRVVVKSDCGTFAMPEMTLTVGDPTDDVTGILVNKYKDWLLMVHVNYLKSLGYVFTESDVSWYKDGAPMSHTGYYYTGDAALYGAYYVKIAATNASGCDATVTSNIITCNGALAPVKLMPTYLGSGEQMNVLNLNPDIETTLRTYDAAGQLMDERKTSGASTLQMRPVGVPGVYMLRVIGDNEQTLKYVITK